jgi:hypothetical protein
MSSHVGPIVIFVFSHEKEAISEELGGQPHEAPWILTFSLSKVSADAYNAYKCKYWILLYLHVMYCAPHIGFLDHFVIGYMVAPFRTLSLF